VAENDLIGLQRAVVELVTDDGARAAWNADPAGFAAARLSGSAAAAVATINPAGLEAMTLSHVAKKERFDYLHRLHHELEAKKAAEHRDGASVAGNGHRHSHGGNHHSHHGGDPS